MARWERSSQPRSAREFNELTWGRKLEANIPRDPLAYRNYLRQLEVRRKITTRLAAAHPRMGAHAGRKTWPAAWRPPLEYRVTQNFFLETRATN